MIPDYQLVLVYDVKYMSRRIKRNTGRPVYIRIQDQIFKYGETKTSTLDIGDNEKIKICDNYKHLRVRIDGEVKKITQRIGED